MAGITQKMLTQQLRDLERDGLIVRTVYAEVPPRVEYALTQKGNSLKTLLSEMREWGEQYGRKVPETSGEALS